MTLKQYCEKRRSGLTSFRLDGQTLRGGFALTRFRTGKVEAWLPVKTADADARRKPVHSQPESVLSGRTFDELS